MATVLYRALQVFDGERFLEKGTAIAVNESGVIAGLVEPEQLPADLPLLPGILAPGLINAHCHLELSHFKQQIPEGGGLVEFLLAVVNKRKTPWPAGQVQQHIQDAAAEMAANGIVGVGDICNTTDAVPTKTTSSLRWHNFVEVLNFSDATLHSRWAHNEAVHSQHLAAGLTTSVLTPHAPYSVSAATFRALNKATAGKVISVHNQETLAEDQLFKSGNGDFARLYALTQTEPLGGSGKSSLQTWLPYFTEGQTIVLVHNTYTTAEDIRFARAHARQYGLQLYWCLCPGANRYIEKTLPPVALLLAEGATLLLGTDSYSSNWQLSIAAEIKLLADGFPNIPLEILLRAATANGAAALRWPGLGKLAIGTQPGICLLHTDAAGRLTGSSEPIG